MQSLCESVNVSHKYVSLIAFSAPCIRAYLADSIEFLGIFLGKIKQKTLFERQYFKMKDFSYTGRVTNLFSTFALNIPLTTNFLIGTFIALAVVWSVQMMVLEYHWKNYGNDKLRVLRMNISYFIGSALLFTTLAFFLVSYSASLPL